MSAQAEAGNVRLARGAWNDGFLRVLENFPEAAHDDEVDALSGAYETLRTGASWVLSPLPTPSRHGRALNYRQTRELVG